MMSTSAKQRPDGSGRRATLVCGLGSSHGDDQLGWRVAERLAPAAGSAASIRAAGSPADLLDWLDGIDRLIVCDACQNLGSPGALHRWRWPDVPGELLRRLGVHDLGLADVLALADQLRRLPAETIIFGVEIEACLPGTPCSASAAEAADRLAETIARELGCCERTPPYQPTAGGVRACSQSR